MVGLSLWGLCGFLVGLWGYLVSPRRELFWLTITLCSAFGPISLLLVIPSLCDTSIEYGTPWYKQGPSFHTYAAIYDAERKAYKQRMLDEHTMVINYKVELASGERFECTKSAKPHVNIGYSKEYWSVNKCNRAFEERVIVEFLEENGLRVNDVVYPWHMIASIKFDEQ